MSIMPIRTRTQSFTGGGSAVPPLPIFIAVVGATGVGKSTFIKALTNDANIRIGTTLKSCTKLIEDSEMLYRNSYKLHLLDTPGFDDDEVSDADILKEIATWLKIQHAGGKKLSGIIYLHRITDERMGGQAARNLHMLRKLCGDDNLKNVVLVTNRWEQLADPEVGHQRVNRDLLGEGGFWRPLVLNNASHMPYDGTPEKARKIIDTIISQSPTVLQIQTEMANGILLMNTEAGKETTTKMEKDAVKLANELAELSAQIIEMRTRVNDATELAQQYQKLYEKQRRDTEALEDMRKLDEKKWEKRIEDLQERLRLKKARDQGSISEENGSGRPHFFRRHRTDPKKAVRPSAECIIS